MCNGVIQYRLLSFMAQRNMIPNPWPLCLKLVTKLFFLKFFNHAMVVEAKPESKHYPLYFANS